MPRPKTGGRVKGTPNKITLELRDLAQQYAPDALQELVRLSREAESEAARIAACKEILDRAYGRAPQAVGFQPDAPLKIEVVWSDPEHYITPV